jgi:hypothetical protein
MLKLLSSNKKNTKCMQNPIEEDKKQPIYSFYEKYESAKSVDNLDNTIINSVVDYDASMNKTLDKKICNMFIDNTNAFSSDSEYESDNYIDTGNVGIENDENGDNDKNDYKNININTYLNDNLLYPF